MAYAINISIMHHGQFMTTEELIEKATEATCELPFDGRSKTEISVRVLRNYLVMKLLTPPFIQNGRRAWTQEHLRELVDIRRAVSAGKSLKKVGESRQRETETPWRLANRGVIRPQMIDVDRMKRDAKAVKAQLTTRQVPKGWSLRLSKDLTLSGFTDLQPTIEETRKLIAVLSRIVPEQFDLYDEDKDNVAAKQEVNG
jgi:DNA-binding transcriptional MerR regulator